MFIEIGGEYYNLNLVKKITFDDDKQIICFHYCGLEEDKYFELGNAEREISILPRLIKKLNG